MSQQLFVAGVTEADVKHVPPYKVERNKHGILYAVFEGTYERLEFEVKFPHYFSKFPVVCYMGGIDNAFRLGRLQ